MTNPRIQPILIVFIWAAGLLNAGCFSHTQAATKNLPTATLNKPGLWRLYPDMDQKELLQMLGRPAAVWNNAGQSPVRIWEYLLVMENGRFKRWAGLDEIKTYAVSLPPVPTKLEAPKDREDMRKYYEMKVRLDAFLAANRDNLKKLSRGMPKKDIMELMGFDTLELGSALIPNPYRIEVSGDKEVIYYFSQIVKPDDTISADNLTPLVFYQGRLVSTGYDSLKNPKEKQ